MTQLSALGELLTKFTKTASVGLALSVIFSSVTSPVFANSAEQPKYIEVEGKSLEIIHDMPIVVNRTSINLPPMVLTQGHNKYKFVRFLNALTQEKEITTQPGEKKKPNLLCRLAEVKDEKTGIALIVALPIVFNPPIKQIGI